MYLIRPVAICRWGRALASVALLAAAPVHAGLFDDDEARKAILELRQKLQETQQRAQEQTQRSADDQAQMRRGMLDLQNQLELVRAELARMRGQDEQLQRDMAELQKLHKDSTQSLDERLRRFEPVKVQVDAQEFLAEPGERRDFEAALGGFRRGDFAAAQSEFTELLGRYPKTGYRQSALFWLGNAQYAQRAYKDALGSFRALVALAGGHARVPEAMLAIANCQLELKDVKSARKTLEDLIGAFPASDAATAAKERLARLR